MCRSSCWSGRASLLGTLRPPEEAEATEEALTEVLAKDTALPVLDGEREDQSPYEKPLPLMKRNIGRLLLLLWLIIVALSFLLFMKHSMGLLAHLFQGRV